MTAPKSILVIDDEAAICLAFRRFFEARGWEVHVAASAGEGQEAFARHRPCVVFLDVRLPDRSGLEVIQWVKLNIDVPPPILLVTSRSDDADVVEGLTVGADARLISSFKFTVIE